MAHQLAIIQGIGFGCRDIGRPCLWFHAYITENMGSLIIITGEQMMSAVEESGVENINRLEGRACIVDVTDDAVRFIKFFQVKH